MPASENGWTQILKELEKSIASFKNGRVPKIDAIASVLRILGENIDVTLMQPQKEAVFDSYLTEILSIQSTFDESGRAGVSRSVVMYRAWLSSKPRLRLGLIQLRLRIIVSQALVEGSGLAQARLKLRLGLGVKKLSNSKGLKTHLRCILSLSFEIR